MTQVFASYKLNINSTTRTLKRPKPKSRGCIQFYKEEFLCLNSRLHQQRQAICDIFIRTKRFLHQLFLLLKGRICHLVLMKRKRGLLIFQTVSNTTRLIFQNNTLMLNFVVINSYSEYGIYKSIKYNVWANTQNGNKKLDGSYQEAQQKPGSCPIFLLFSVNTSGKFVGLAEMIGPVDFNKSLEYLQ